MLRKSLGARLHASFRFIYFRAYLSLIKWFYLIHLAKSSCWYTNIFSTDMFASIRIYLYFWTESWKSQLLYRPYINSPIIGFNFDDNFANFMAKLFGFRNYFQDEDKSEKSSSSRISRSSWATNIWNDFKSMTTQFFPCACKSSHTRLRGQGPAPNENFQLRWGDTRVVTALPLFTSAFGEDSALFRVLWDSLTHLWCTLGIAGCFIEPHQSNGLKHALC